MVSARDEDLSLLPSPGMPTPVPEREHLVFMVCRQKMKGSPVLA